MTVDNDHVKVKERGDKWRWLKGGRWGQTTFIEGDNDNTIKQTICPPELLCRGNPNIENITFEREIFSFYHTYIITPRFTHRFEIRKYIIIRYFTDTIW